MSENTSFDFWYAVQNTHLLHSPTSNLETFGTTVLHYHLVTELLDSVNQIRVREGKVKASRPEIIAPNSVFENLLDNFGSDAHEYAEWLRTHETDLMIMKYGFAVGKEHLTEEIVTGELRPVAERVRDVVTEKNDPLAAVLIGVEKPWEVCLLKLMVDVVQQSAPGNARTLFQQGIRSEADWARMELKRDVEQAFAAAAVDESRLDGLAKTLKQNGLFAEYEDRFFALVRKHR